MRNIGTFAELWGSTWLPAEVKAELLIANEHREAIKFLFLFRFNIIRVLQKFLNFQSFYASRIMLCYIISFFILADHLIAFRIQKHISLLLYFF